MALPTVNAESEGRRRERTRPLAGRAGLRPNGAAQPSSDAEALTHTRDKGSGQVWPKLAEYVPFVLMHAVAEKNIGMPRVDGYALNASGHMRASRK